jgi:hypothetical protein
MKLSELKVGQTQRRIQVSAADDKPGWAIKDRERWDIMRKAIRDFTTKSAGVWFPKTMHELQMFSVNMMNGYPDSGVEALTKAVSNFKTELKERDKDSKSAWMWSTKK